MQPFEKKLHAMHHIGWLKVVEDRLRRGLDI
jgi:hypothetical protein